MPTQNEFKRAGLDFEKFVVQPNDIRISKILTTPKGDKIRAVVTASNDIIVTGLGDANGNTIIWTGDGQATEIPSLGEIWDGLKSLGKGVWDKLTKGQNCTPVQSQVIKTNKDGTVTITTTTRIECKPA